MSILLHGDCLDHMKSIDDNSVDLIFCDLPYGQTSCAWDIIIPWEPFWNEIMRIKKLNAPLFFTTTTKFGVELINNAPKKCPFRYDIVWVKSAPAGFLSAKKMPMRKHEMVYVFYEKLPFYDLSSHKHKFIKDEKDVMTKDFTANKNGNIYDCPDNQEFAGRNGKPRYEPPLPVSVVKEQTGGATMGECYGNIDRSLEQYKECGKRGKNQILYDPPLPNSLLEIKSTRGKHSTEKPVALMEWILKYYSKEGDVVLDPTMGSGSTGVACKNMNRNFIGIEKDPEIYETALNRIED
tara:strand:+ start:1469 stop:2350 length:882 start_codon:yes stop_codon:yes gene_type:complete